MRDYIPGIISIDGRNIKYKLITASDYLKAKNGWSEEQVEEFREKYDGLYALINTVMALKHSCYLLKRVSYSDSSLERSLYELKENLMNELIDVYCFCFDDEFVENYGFN